jgi:HNH endonuclease/AP2 domain
MSIYHTENLSLQRLKDLLQYDPDTGLFTRLIKTSNRSPVGSIVGCKRKDGYITIRIDGKAYFSHRLAFLYMEGIWPDEIDHIDGNPSNNKWSNLRQVNSGQNKMNRRRKDGKEYKGVVWHKQGQKWMAQINKDREHIYLGLFDNPKDAYKAYCEAATLYHGEYAKYE